MLHFLLTWSFNQKHFFLFAFRSSNFLDDTGKTLLVGLMCFKPRSKICCQLLQGNARLRFNRIDDIICGQQSWIQRRGIWVCIRWSRRASTRRFFSFAFYKRTRLSFAACGYLWFLSWGIFIISYFSLLFALLFHLCIKTRRWSRGVNVRAAWGYRLIRLSTRDAARFKVLHIC